MEQHKVNVVLEVWGKSDITPVDPDFALDYGFLWVARCNVCGILEPSIHYDLPSHTDPMYECLHVAEEHAGEENVHVQSPGVVSSVTRKLGDPYI